MRTSPALIAGETMLGASSRRLCPSGGQTGTTRRRRPCEGISSRNELLSRRSVPSQVTVHQPTLADGERDAGATAVAGDDLARVRFELERRPSTANHPIRTTSPLGGRVRYASAEPVLPSHAALRARE